MGKSEKNTDSGLMEEKTHELATLVGDIINKGSSIRTHSSQIENARQRLIDWAKEQSSEMRIHIADDTDLGNEIRETTGKNIDEDDGIELIRDILKGKLGKSSKVGEFEKNVTANLNKSNEERVGDLNRFLHTEAKDNAESVQKIRQLLVGWRDDSALLLSKQNAKQILRDKFKSNEYRRRYLIEFVDNGRPSLEMALYNAAGYVTSTKVDWDEILALITAAKPAELKEIGEGAKKELQDKLGKEQGEYLNAIFHSNKVDEAYQKNAKGRLAEGKLADLALARTQELGALVNVIINEGSAFKTRKAQIENARPRLTDWAKKQPKDVLSQVIDHTLNALTWEDIDIKMKESLLIVNILRKVEKNAKTKDKARTPGAQPKAPKDQITEWVPKYEKQIKDANPVFPGKTMYSAIARLGSYTLEIYKGNTLEAAVEIFHGIRNKLDKEKLAVLENKQMLELRAVAHVLLAGKDNISEKIKELSSADTRIETITEGKFASKGVRKGMLEQAIADADGASLLTWTDIDTNPARKELKYYPTLNPDIEQKLDQSYIEHGTVHTAYTALMGKLADAMESDTAFQKAYWEKTKPDDATDNPPKGYFKARAQMLRGKSALVEQQYSESGVQWTSLSAKSGLRTEAKDEYTDQLIGAHGKITKGKECEVDSEGLEQSAEKLERRTAAFQATREKYNARFMMALKLVLSVATTVASMGLASIPAAGFGMELVVSLLPSFVSAATQQGATAWLEGGANFDTAAAGHEILKTLLLTLATVGAGHISADLIVKEVPDAENPGETVGAVFGRDSDAAKKIANNDLLKNLITVSPVEAICRSSVE
ncbi:MAG: hypothetical protein KJO08_07015, partial [Gammaproteobacteria bacterium]|nr:hypothetical protein [Gammaproteobacteria bacterium]